MKYTKELIEKARQLNELITIDYNGQFHVEIKNVFYREKHTFHKLSLSGSGTTIDDACYDYIRKARGGLMIHVISDKTIEVV